jgi:hypothetical protein
MRVVRGRSTATRSKCSILRLSQALWVLGGEAMTRVWAKVSKTKKQRLKQIICAPQSIVTWFSTARRCK